MGRDMAAQRNGTIVNGTCNGLEKEKIFKNGCNPLLELYETTSAWTLKEELRVNKEITRKHVDDLRAWIDEQGDQVAPISDRLLIAFIHSCHSDLEKAKVVIGVYSNIRRNTPEVFENRPVRGEDVQHAFMVGYFIALPHKTKDGLRIKIMALRNPDPALFVHSLSCKAQFLTIDACIHADPTATGYAFLYDMRRIQMAHMWKWSFWLSRAIFKYLQEGMPLRIQGVYFLYASSLMNNIMRVFRPFVNRDLWSMLHVYTEDSMEEFYKIVPRDCLPEEYGGTLPSVDILQKQNMEWLERMETILP